MNPEGRPKTRSLEQQMVAIYKLIHREMVNQESRNVSKACQSVFNKVELIKFTDPALPDHQRLTDVCKNPENLRKRYYRSIECANDGLTFPILHHTVKTLSESLGDEIERHKHLREDYARQDQEGRLFAYKHKVPVRFARKP